MKKVDTIVVADFDGTVARRDVGFDFFVHFSGGRNSELVSIWKSGKLSTRECLRREVALVTVNKNEINSFLDKFELDPGFGDFAALCKAEDVQLAIASEGLDFYIEYLLKRHKFAHIPAASNKAVFEGACLRIEFPYDNGDCRNCGNCKAERIRDLKNAHGNGCRVVFIGDGYSDACATRAADVVFAKRDLKKYCDNNKLEYHDYENFFDVAQKLTEMGVLS